MDQSVLDAVKRWPNVPAVYGWLSLTARGEWKLHPLGDAQSGGAGTEGREDERGEEDGEGADHGDSGPLSAGRGPE